MTRIALIEDNPDNRLLVQAILEGEFEVLEYEDGPTALATLKADAPDLVLLDISLPGMDGVEVLQQIRDDDDLCSLRVIALTAHAMSGDREKYLALGFDAYLSKPIVDDELLLSTIREQIDA